MNAANPLRAGVRREKFLNCSVLAGFALGIVLGLCPDRLKANNHPNHIRDERDQHACGLAGYNGEECSTNCTGLAHWWVSEPYCTLWLEDEPLSYQPSRGPRVSLHLTYKDRNTRSPSQYAYSFGQGWECSWMSSVGVDHFLASRVGNPTNVTFGAVVYLPGGGVQRYEVLDQPLEGPNWPTDYVSQTRLVPIVNASLGLAGLERRFPDGAKDVYQVWGPGTNQYATFQLSARVDAVGNTTSFSYDGSAKLSSVQDVDGRSTALSYTSGLDPNLVSQVTDGFGRTVTFQYYRTILGTTFLTNILDPEGLFSRMTYDTNVGNLKILTTPYGHTYFTRGGHASGEYMGDWPLARILIVDDAVGGRHIYAYSDVSTNVTPNSYADAPTSSSPLGTVENNEMNAANSFCWGPRQSEQLSTNQLDFLTPADYLKARLRHWLLVRDASPQEVGATLSFERAFTPDGVNFGHRIWYDYPNKPNTHMEGFSGLPGVILWRNPDNTVYYLWSGYNLFGYPTNVVETWSTTESSPVLLRTNRFVYATNGIDLAMVRKTIQRGTQYYDTVHGTVSHVLQGGMASGKTLQVAVDPISGNVVTVISRSRFNPATKLPDGSSRYIPIE